jgi:hypothetical protein
VCGEGARRGEGMFWLTFLEGKEAKKIIVRFQEVTVHITAGK